MDFELWEMKFCLKINGRAEAGTEAKKIRLNSEPDFRMLFLYQSSFKLKRVPRAMEIRLGFVIRT